MYIYIQCIYIYIVYIYIYIVYIYIYIHTYTDNMRKRTSSARTSRATSCPRGPSRTFDGTSEVGPDKQTSMFNGVIQGLDLMGLQRGYNKFNWVTILLVCLRGPFTRGFCSMVQYSIVWYGMVWCSVVQYSMVQCSIVQCSVVQYSIVYYSRVEQSRVEYTKQSTEKQSRVEQSRVEQSRVEQSRVEQSRVEQSRVEYRCISRTFHVRGAQSFQQPTLQTITGNQ